MASGLPAHLRRLEAESIQIMREVVAEIRNPVMLYSIGKDSSVMLHLALKAFYPAQAAVPAAACRHDLEVPRDDRLPRRDGASGSASICSSTSTRTGSSAAFPDRLRLGAAYPGDEDRSACARRSTSTASTRRSAARGATRRRAAPRSASSRTAPPAHAWDPRNQRPELWRLFNTRLQAGRIDAGVSALQLDRTRRLGIHPRREHSGRAALFRQAAARWSSATAR